MGKKVKVGKTRKDKFYQLAKEAGYRSRAAFKLLQLNRTYHFLEKSRICIDLCAAPGGWLQVAASQMPLSSVIIGIDLAPIKSIANVITHQEDITSDKCRSLLKKDLSDNKADVVLHDGAPNVGKNWIHDAYQQNILVLQAFKLATEFLRKGGFFITKVFRSKDYYSIMWVFQQFFKKVESTKPQASRNESAEIFVVCQHYKAPDRIDPKFFDIKFVFSEVEKDNEKKTLNDLFKNQMITRNRGGYPEGDLTLFHKLNASEFIKSDNFVELLAKSNEIELDEEKIQKHPATTEEIRECIKDIKLLGKNEIKNLLKWRLRLKADLYKSTMPVKQKDQSDKNEEEKVVNEISDDEKTENIKLENEIKDALLNEKKMDKKKKKKLEKERRKLKEKLSLKMNFQNDIVDHNLQGDNEIFSLNKIRTKKQLMDLQDTLPGLEFSDDEEHDGQSGVKNGKKLKVSFSKFDEDDDRHLDSNEEENDENQEPELNQKQSLNNKKKKKQQKTIDNAQLGYSDDEDDENPLLNNLENLNGSAKQPKGSSWFNQDAFDFLDDSADKNEEILNSFDLDATKPNGIKRSKEESSDDDDDDDDEEDEKKNDKKRKNSKAAKKGKFDSKSEENDEPNKVKLTPEELAVGEMLINSKKVKNQLIDDSFNRYSVFDDSENLPDWFIEDEKEHFKKPVPIPKEVLEKYKQKTMEINARPIKKVVEAQARKKRRLTKKLEKARKKAEVLSDKPDMTESERNKEIKTIYKKAGLLAKKKTDVKYVVSKKGFRGKQVAKSKGVKGPYKMVDKRLKKDKRVMKRKNMRRK